MSTIEKDFDRLALLDSDGWTHNNHYHNFLLRHVPENCVQALEIGCGTGAFSRRLAEQVPHVHAIDLSPEMIRVAKSRSEQFPNLEFQVGDAVSWDFPSAHFDCIATLATLHHVPLREVLAKMKAALKPEGVLIALDLFEPERNLLKPAGWRDTFTNLIALGASGSLRLIHNGRLQPPREVRAAWEEHGTHDSYPTMSEIRSLCAELFPGASIRKHLLWRYSIIWQKPACQNP
jgi:ubiquinone/menaquinone biosynthesis C-methylase UbiE